MTTERISFVSITGSLRTQPQGISASADHRAAGSSLGHSCKEHGKGPRAGWIEISKS